MPTDKEVLAMLLLMILVVLGVATFGLMMVGLLLHQYDAVLFGFVLTSILGSCVWRIVKWSSQ